MSFEKYPAVRTRLRKDALALKRRVDALLRAIAQDADGISVAGIAWDAERIANCIAADCRDIQRVAEQRANEQSVANRLYGQYLQPQVDGGAA